MKKIPKKKYSTGGETNVGLSLLSQAPNILNQVIGAIENNPTAYSRQPTLNASTMRQMVTPYSQFAMGGDVDEDTMAQLQQMADEQGISIEELIAQLQHQDMPDEEASEDDNLYPDDEGSEQFAMGGQTKPIEVEGKEVVQTPDGNMFKMGGPSHEEGGIDINVPEGTKIYSDRLQIDGKTMQERKLAREKTMARLDKLKKKNPQDKLLGGTYERTMEIVSKEEANDMNLQKVMNKIYNATNNIPGTKKAAYGDEVTGPGDGVLPINSPLYFIPNGTAGSSIFNYAPTTDMPYSPNPTLPPVTVQNTPRVSRPMAETITTPKAGYSYSTPTTLPTGSPSIAMNPKFAGKSYREPHPLFDDITTGDIIGMGGNLWNAIAPIVNTRKAAQNTRPNVNRFIGFGHDALDTNETAQDIIAGLRGSAMTDVNTAANTSFVRNRNSARGINTLRALDTASDMVANKARQAANDSYSKSIIGLLGQRAGLQNQRDLTVMKGEAARDIEDKADRDNYYSNMAENLVNFGNNIQGIGKAFNVAKSNKIDRNLLSQLSQYGLTFDEDGNLISK